MAFANNRPMLFAILATLTTAALLIAGNGMTPVWPLIWIAPIPILILAAETTSTLLAATAAFLAMLLGSLNMLFYFEHWALRAPVLAWLIPFSLASLFFTAGVLLFRFFLRRNALFAALIALPAFWSLTEFLASFVPANGTAGSLAYTQQRFLPILQLASLTGPWGITFLLLLFPSAITIAIYLRRRNLPHATPILASTFAILAAAIAFGMVRLAAPSPQQAIKVGLLDTDTVLFADTAPALQTLLHHYADQAQLLANQGAKIIVMPEKTGLFLDRDAPTLDPILQSVANRTRATLIIGVVHAVAPNSFNEARIYTPQQPIATYDKQHLLPPFESNLTPGSALTLLPNSPAPIGVAICKDMDFIHPALDYGRANIDLLLDPAWDFNIDRTWHGHIAIMRGVEGGYAIAHSAKDGFLTATDDRGRILAETRTDTTPFAHLLVNIPLHHDRTFFDRHGTWFPYFTTLLLLATALASTQSKRKPLNP
jgi:apolipoprotein N-acyltransferase